MKALMMPEELPTLFSSMRVPAPARIDFLEDCLVHKGRLKPHHHVGCAVSHDDYYSEAHFWGG